MIRNFLKTQKQVMPSSHDGSGPVDVYEIWQRSDFKSNVDFIDRMVVPPKSTVGYHRHGRNEEIYIVLSGQAEMTIDGKVITVNKGDMILNTPYGEHDLQNNSDESVDVLVIQISVAE